MQDPKPPRLGSAQGIDVWTVTGMFGTIVRSDSAGAVNPNWGVKASVPCAVP